MLLDELETRDYQDWIDTYFLLLFLVGRVEKIKSCLILGKKTELLEKTIREQYPDAVLAGEEWESGQWDLVLVREQQPHNTLCKVRECMPKDGLLVMRLPYREREYAKAVEKAGFAFLFENWPTDTVTMVYEPEGKKNDTRE